MILSDYGIRYAIKNGDLKNCSNKPIKLKVGFPIGQITFHYLTSGCDKPYDGAYNGQRGATISKYIDMIR